MQGFDYEKAKCVCKLHHDYAIEAMIAIGKPGKTEDLPQDIQEKRLLRLADPLKN